MHIKKIIIQGFKTYKNTTVIDEVSPNFNVVVGRNGSGKSNFFAAIRFVLSDAYTHMTREERQGLIHEGSGTVMSAYVEIIFDNVDRRVPISRDEVLVRRTIGLKKDDYSLDGKSATRSDIMNLLESAGFSRSNPYYIVPQGRITALTNSKDSERLSLLKDVSGAKVFESKLKESLKEMTNSNLKRRRIDEALDSINERLSDLQIESDDLKEYQQLERSKKIFEFNIFDRELNDLLHQIDTIDSKYAKHLADSQQDLLDLEERDKALQRLQEDIRKTHTDLKVAALEKDQTDTYYKQLLTTISNKEVKVDELRQSTNYTKSKTQEATVAINNYNSLIAEAKAKIEEYHPQLESLREKESHTKQILIELSTKQRSLYSKQNRFLKFSSKKERDSWLKSQISNLSKNLKTKEIEINRVNDAITSKKEDIFDLNQKLDELKESLNDDTRNNEINEIQKSINDLKLQVTDMSDRRKALWREEIKLKSISDSIMHDLNNTNNLVNQTMDRAQSQGLTAMAEIVKSLKLEDSVYGPLADLFHVSDKYKTATEVVAGNSLFHVVVDTDKTASMIMEELVRTKSGRVTFMPLNRLVTPEVNYPNSNDHQCIPLIKKIKYDKPEISKAISHVFAKTIVCSELQKGSELAKMFNINAITLDGDRADLKGILSGGFRDYKSSRLDVLKLQTKKKNELVKIKEDHKICEQNIEVINKEFTELNNKLNFDIRKLDKKLSESEPIKSEISQLKDRKYNLEHDLRSLQSNYDTVFSIKQNLVTNLEQHKAELNSAYSQSLSEEEISLMKSLTEKISKYENSLDKVVTQSAEMDAKLSQYESELNSNLVPHLEKLLNDRENPRSRLDKFEIEELTNELEKLNSQLEAMKSRNEGAIKEYERLSEIISQNEKSLKIAKDQQMKIVDKVEKQAKSVEKSLNKKSILENRQDEVQRKIRDLGVLPEEAFDAEKFDRYGSDELLGKLNEINGGLSKYAHINKKAVEQFNIFTVQHNDLIKRREELDNSKESIDTLIKNLETQKDEAITKSFKSVAKCFHEIFEQLVPAGVGHLVMQKKASDSQIGIDDDTEEGDDDGNKTIDIDMDDKDDIENYTGVSISVSFNSKHDEQQRIEQLSGGQKSLCAIALILAIQKCDPAPFYLFDEIDANLDSQYRTAVSSLIKSLSHKAQFICTSFRPEMLQVTDKFYGVTFNDKVSTVSDISKDEATSFVEGQQQR